MNYKTSKTPHPTRLPRNLTDNINLKRSDKYVVLSNLGIYYTWNFLQKTHTKIINLKYHLRHEMGSLNYPMDHIQDYFESILKNMDERLIISEYT